MNSPDLHLRPQLASYVRLRPDPVTGDPVLLYPEGLLVLNDTAHEIVRRCDGQIRISELVARLAEEFEADEDLLQADVLETLASLHRQNLLVYLP